MTEEANETSEWMTVVMGARQGGGDVIDIVTGCGCHWDPVTRVRMATSRECATPGGRAHVGHARPSRASLLQSGILEAELRAIPDPEVQAAIAQAWPEIAR